MEPYHASTPPPKLTGVCFSSPVRPPPSPLSRDRHFMQRVLNKVDTEMSATQASGVVLGDDPSHHSTDTHYHHAWDYVKLAVAVEAGVNLPEALAIGDDLNLGRGGGGEDAGGGGGGGDPESGNDGDARAAAGGDGSVDDGGECAATGGSGRGSGDEHGGGDDEGGGADGPLLGDADDDDGAGADGADADRLGGGGGTLGDDGLFGDDGDEAEPGDSGDESEPGGVGDDGPGGGALDEGDEAELADLAAVLSGRVPDGGDNTARRAPRGALDVDKDHSGEAPTSRTGTANVFRHTVTGQSVPVSDAMHYAFRCLKLRRVNAIAFKAIYKIGPMSEKDRAWRAAAASERKAQPVTAGRPRVRFPLRSPHPLSLSHVIVKKAKWGVHALAGAPPPRLPLDASTAAKRKARREWAKWYGANIIPWICAGDDDDIIEPPSRSAASDDDDDDGAASDDSLVGPLDEPDAALSHHERVVLSYAPKLKHKEVARYIAGLRAAARDASPSEDLRAKRRRYRRHGAYALITNTMTGFVTAKVQGIVLAKHRNRARTLWTSANRPGGGGGDDDGYAARRAMAAKSIAELRDRIALMRGGGTLASREAMSHQRTQWTAALLASLPSARLGTPVGSASASLRREFAAAAAPTRRSMEPNPLDPKAVEAALKLPLPPRQDPSEGDGAGGEDGGEGGEEGDPPLSPDDSLAPISEEEYGRLAAEWGVARDAAEARGETPPQPPFNPEQRAAARPFARYVSMRKRMQDNGCSIEEIAAAARSAELPAAILMIGAGGTGKSAVIYELRCRCEAAGTHLVITAFVITS